jgi:hypothetical protein
MAHTSEVPTGEGRRQGAFPDRRQQRRGGDLQPLLAHRSKAFRHVGTRSPPSVTPTACAAMAGLGVGRPPRARA